MCGISTKSDAPVDFYEIFDFFISSAVRRRRLIYNTFSIDLVEIKMLECPNLKNLIFNTGMDG